MSERPRVVVVDVDELAAIVEAAVERALEARASTDPVEWLDANGAAELLGVHRRTITKMAKRGELRAARIGKLLRFRRSDVVGLLEPDAGAA